MDLYRKHKLARASLVLLSILQFCRLCIADDWPQWRGPQRNGVSTEKGWSDTWPSSGPLIAWKANVGLGFSSFVVAASRGFTLGHADAQDTVWCFDANTGKVLWKHSYPADLGDKFFEGGTTGTPTIVGDRLFTLSRWGDAFCFEAATGKIIWSMNIQKEADLPVPTWGFTGAPLAYENLLILNVGDAGMALEQTTGKIVWKSANKSAGYSTPLPVQRDGKWLTIFANSSAYVAVNPSDGKEVWRVRWLTEYGVNASDPIVNGDLMFIATGYGKGAALFKLGTGEPEQVWKSKALRTQVNPAVLYDGNLYGPDGDTGEHAPLKCLEFTTGKELWAQAHFGVGAVSIADGKLIAMSGAGELIIAPATASGFKPTARAQLFGGNCWTVPVLANGRIYCRNGRGDVVVVDAQKK